MDRIASFSVDHRLLEPGIYVSRIDCAQTPNEQAYTHTPATVTTFDVRMCAPNRDEVLSTACIHALEHLLATWLRNDKTWAKRLVYVGPMGCRTGFYILVFGDASPAEIAKPLTEAFEFVRDYSGNVPGAKPEECGNWSDSSLEEAKQAATRFLNNTLYCLDEAHMNYPAFLEEEAAQEHASQSTAATDSRAAAQKHCEATLLDKQGINQTQQRIGIIGAMEVEIALLRDSMQNAQVSQYAGMRFFEGLLHGVSAVVVKSGIGMVNAGLCAGILIDKFKVSAIINTGIAGSLCDELDIGDIVVADRCVNHLMDVSALGYKPGETPNLPITFETDPHLSSILKNAIGQTAPCLQLRSGCIASGDRFICSDEEKLRISNTFGALCAEMEGAAIGQVCYLLDTPFAVVRALSDRANGESPEDYPAFEKQAAHTCADAVLAAFAALK